MSDTTTTAVQGTERPEDIFYGDPESIETRFRPVLMDTLNVWRDRTGASSAAAVAEMREASVMFDDARISSQFADRVYGTMMRYAAQPADDTTAAEWATESRRQLRERYGPDEAEKRLAAVQQFVKNRPALAKRLHASGAGSHPDIVVPLAERAEELRIVPRKRK